MPQISIEQMRKLIERLDEARQIDENIPQSYIDRLERSGQLLGDIKTMKPIDWDNLNTADDIERAEAMIHRKLDLKNEIEKHLNTCGLTVAARGGRGGAAVRGRQRQPRRSKEQMAYDQKVADVTKKVKKDLGLAARGRISEDDRQRLETALEKELNRLKIHPPKA